jgi:RHS repeat-associated protein
MMTRFDMSLYSPTGHNTLSTIYLIQPNGIQVAFQSILGDQGSTDGVWEHTASPGPFYKAVIRDRSPYYEMTLRDGTVYTFYGYSSGRLQSIQDRFGNRIEIARTPALSGQMTKIISQHGRYIEFEYGTFSNITKARDHSGREVLYEYYEVSGPGYRRLKTVTMPDAGKWTYTYTASGRVESITDPRNNRTVFNEYDADSRLWKQTYADDKWIEVLYTTSTVTNEITLADVKDRRGKKRRVFFDHNQQITQNIYPLGEPEEQTTNYARDYISGRLDTVTDDLQRVTKYEYDPLGNGTKVTRMYGTAEATSEIFEFDPKFSVLTSYTDARQKQTIYKYDDLGNLKQVKDPNQNSTFYTYDSAGRARTVKDALDHITTLTYNGPDLVSITNHLQHTTQMGHDALGRLRLIRDPLNNATELTFDGMDRLKLAKDPLGGELARGYDPIGNLTSFEDQDDNVTTYDFDVMNRRSWRKDALLRKDDSQYEPGSLLQRYTDRKGQVSGMRYDGLGRRTFVGYGATAASPKLYTNGIRYTWDDGNRLTLIEDGSCSGQDCATFTVASTLNRDYDGLSRLKEERSAQGKVNYTYYPDGLRETTTVQGQPTITYTWDDGRRLRFIDQAAGESNGGVAQRVEIRYDDANRRKLVLLPNGITIAHDWDDANRLTGLTYKRADGSLIGDLVYGYDDADRRTSVTGSLANVRVPAGVGTAGHNTNNQLTQWDGSTLTYDANGNLQSDGTQWYVWNERDQLKEIRQGSATGALVVSYDYDAVGRRVARKQGGTTTGYLHDGWNVVQELNDTTANAGRNNYKANVLNGMALDERYGRWVAPNSGQGPRGGPANKSNPSATQPLLSYFLVDALGSTLALAKADQALQAQYSYEPYGATQQTTPSGQTASDNPYQYTGRENEAASSTGNLAPAANNPARLYHYRHRFYATNTARFVSEDPIEFEGGENLYSYADGGPTDFYDPLGLAPDSDGGSSGDPIGCGFQDTCKQICKNVKRNLVHIIICIVCLANDKRPPPPPPKPPVPNRPIPKGPPGSPPSPPPPPPPEPPPPSVP